MAEWREVSPRQGIVDLSFPLAAEPALGMYIIEVEGKSHSFSVKDNGAWGRRLGSTRGVQEPSHGMARNSQRKKWAQSHSLLVSPQGCPTLKC